MGVPVSTKYTAQGRKTATESFTGTTDTCTDTIKISKSRELRRWDRKNDQRKSL
jgi:hypothetical protein